MGYGKPEAAHPKSTDRIHSGLLPTLFLQGGLSLLTHGMILYFNAAKEKQWHIEANLDWSVRTDC